MNYIVHIQIHVSFPVSQEQTQSQPPKNDENCSPKSYPLIVKPDPYARIIFPLPESMY